MGKRRLSGDEAVVLAVNKTIDENMKWFYEQIKLQRVKVTEEMITSSEKTILERGMTHLSDICRLFGWEKGKDTEVRNKLAKLSYSILLSRNGNADAAAILFDAMKRGLKEDVKEPVDLVLSKKEGRKARAFRKSLAANGINIAEKMGIPKTASDKVAARKERARIRKEAKRLGISTAEYKSQHSKKETVNGQT